MPAAVREGRDRGQRRALFRVVPYVLFRRDAWRRHRPTLGTDSLAPADAIAARYPRARGSRSRCRDGHRHRFGSPARGAMMIGFLAEPALLMVLFTASSSARRPRSRPPSRRRTASSIHSEPSPSPAWRSMVSLAENARIPIDNPSTHLELTMIHEAMILEYSGRHLRSSRAASLKLFVYSVHRHRALLPVRDRARGRCTGLLLALPALVLKLAIGGFLLALIETLSAKMRIFRAPEFLGTAFMLAVLALLLHAFLETS
jgi:formate hydrogenlyase subunit 4